MNLRILIRSLLTIALVALLIPFSFASKVTASRNINLAGLIFNVQTLTPVEDAKIYDTDGNILGTSDKNGYYRITINDTTTGEIHFKIKIVKQGFRDFVQQEHWGKRGDSNTIMYFGLKELHSATASFAAFADRSPNNDDLGYNNVLHHFDKVKEQKVFNDKLFRAKAGNENVLVSIDDKLYIVDNNGWININSDKDLITIDNEKAISADKLNTAIKRKNVKWMTPLDSKDAKFGVYTKSRPQSSGQKQ